MNLFHVTKKQPSGGLEIKTATGDIASFTTHYSEPLPPPFNGLNVKCTINPLQDLHGYDHPWAGGGGKNKLPNTFEQGDVSASVGNAYENCKVASDVTIRTINLISINNATMTVSIKNGFSFALQFFDNDQKLYIDTGSNQWLTSPTTISNVPFVAVIIKKNDGTTITPSQLSNAECQLEFGSTATPYAPYENICPIVGHSELNLVRCGVNLWNGDSHDGKGMGGTGTEYTDTASFATLFVPVVPNTTIYLNPTNWRNWINWYKADQTFLSQSVVDSNNEITVPVGAAYARFTGILAEKATAMVCFASQKTEPYAPYNGETFTVQFGQTVYGGVYDANRGKVRITYARVNMGDLTYWDNGSIEGGHQFATNITDKAIGTLNILSSMFEALYPSNAIGKMAGRDNNTIVSFNSAEATIAAFKTSVAGQDLAYELATPIEIDVSELSVDTIVGVNNVFADTGSVEVKYLDVV